MQLAVRVAFILLSCRVAAGAAPAVADGELLRAFETGASLVLAEPVSWRIGEVESRCYYTVRVRRLLVKGDLSWRDGRRPVEVFAGWRYGRRAPLSLQASQKRLRLGAKYILFLDRRFGGDFAWAWRPLAIEADDPRVAAEVEAQARRVYGSAPIRGFRDGLVGTSTRLPPLPWRLTLTCAWFRIMPGHRGQAAQYIWESDLGSENAAGPGSSFTSFLPPKVVLTRAQVLRLLGKPSWRDGTSTSGTAAGWSVGIGRTGRSRASRSRSGSPGKAWSSP